ncbi:hypothetical protein ABLU29_07590 [Lactococcus lactis]|uniref:hypothetical protein n=1 Tax=Lactococcus lactis TaxID=1358 RepID=UPI003877D288
MKKVILSGLIMVVLFSLGACGKGKSSELNGTYKASDDVAPYELTFKGDKIIVDGGAQSENSDGATGTYEIKGNKLIIKDEQTSYGGKTNKKQTVEFTKTNNSIVIFGKTFIKQ